MTMLPVSKLTLNLRFTTPANLPYWMGSAFRGVFGNQIRRILCNNLDKPCSQCNTRENCLFYYMYEREVAKRGYAPPQRPIVLVPPFFGKPMNFEESAELGVDLLFFGDFGRYVPHILLGLRLAGQEGLGSLRHYRLNKFEIANARCAFSGEDVYDGETINLSKIKTVDATDIPKIDDNTLKIGFRTPFTATVFPPPLEELLALSRNRLIRFVNEYGTGEHVPQFEANGDIKSSEEHYHRLERRSKRSDKKYFNSHTGIVDYEIEKIDDVGRWILGAGLVIGCGPDSSFGCGFFNKV